MGRNSRARRAAKQRRDGRGGQRTRFEVPFGRPFSGEPDPSTAMLAEQVVLRAAAAAGDLGAARAQAEQLGVHRPGPSPAVAIDTLHALLGRWIAATTQHGWQPDDLAAVARRRAGASDLTLLGQLVSVATSAHPQSRVDPRWRSQLDALTGGGDPGPPGLSTIDELASGLLLLGMVARLPRLATLIPPPGHARIGASSDRGSGVDAKMLARVRALLAKAESTDFPEEAEALSGKAQELMSRHALERLVGLAGETGRSDEPVGGRRMWLDSPYLMAKAMLVDAVASANRCRSVFSEDLGFVSLVGADQDLDSVELLVASLLVQADRVMLGHGRHQDWQGTSRTRSFRQSFLVAFASRIGERLRQVSADEVLHTGQSVALVPVLRDRSERVDATVSELFPQLRPRSASINNATGWAAGRAAADLARLDTRQQVPATASTA